MNCKKKCNCQGLICIWIPSQGALQRIFFFSSLNVEEGRAGIRMGLVGFPKPDVVFLSQELQIPFLLPVTLCFSSRIHCCNQYIMITFKFWIVYLICVIVHTIKYECFYILIYIYYIYIYYIIFINYIYILRCL